jgi:hypothetical protein
MCVPTRDLGSTPRQDHASDAIPTRSEVNQLAPTPNTQNLKARTTGNVSYRSGEEIHAEDLTWVVMATVYTHTIEEFTKHRTTSVAPCFDIAIQTAIAGTLINRKTALWKEFL